MGWERVSTVKLLESKKRVLFKKGATQIVVLQVAKKLYAIDNRCPHQGYPLMEGTADSDCTLTCHWHNWKFDLASGKCVSGGDEVQVYPVKVEKGEVWVDTTGPSKEESIKKVLDGYMKGFHGNKLGRMTRELTKMQQLGGDFREPIRQIIMSSYQKFPKGMPHSISVMADWFRFYEAHAADVESQLICLMEMSDVLSAEAYNVADKPFSNETKPFSKADFLHAIEERDETAAVSYLKGAFKDQSYADLEPIFLEAALAHTIDSGHVIINLHRVHFLHGLFSGTVWQPLLLLLLRSLCYGTREDLIPGFDKVDTSGALSYEALVMATSNDLLQFDESFQYAFDKPVSQNKDFKDVAHGVLFAHAAGTLCKEVPRLLPKALKQLSYFHQKNKSFLADADRSGWKVTEEKAFLKAAADKILDHGQTAPLQTTHWAQLYWAAVDLGNPSLFAALNRTLETPLKAKHLRRKARQNLSLIKLG